MSIHEAFEAIGESVANWLMAREGIVVDNQEILYCLYKLSLL
jgi:hypothetical protein